MWPVWGVNTVSSGSSHTHTVLPYKALLDNYRGRQQLLITMSFKNKVHQCLAASEIPVTKAPTADPKESPQSSPDISDNDPNVVEHLCIGLSCYCFPESDSAYWVISKRTGHRWKKARDRQHHSQLQQIKDSFCGLQSILSILPIKLWIFTQGTVLYIQNLTNLWWWKKFISDIISDVRFWIWFTNS